MKNKFSKILSSLLILSFLIAMFSVFSFAEGSEDEGGYTLYVHRTFDEGWAINNGLKLSAGSNNIFVDHEEKITKDYNYFTRIEVGGTAASNGVYYSYGKEAVLPGNEPYNSTLEFSIKTDDAAQLGTIIYMKTVATSSSSETVNLVHLDAEQNIILFPNLAEAGKSLNLGKLENKWLNIGFIFDTSLTGVIKGTVHYGYGDGYQNSQAFEVPLKANTGGGVYTYYFGLPALASRTNTVAEESMGMSYCIDNVKIYSGAPEFQDIGADDFGTKVDRNFPITVDIQKNANDKSKAQVLEESLAMKVGVDSALIRGVKYALVGNEKQENYSGVYGAPQVDAEGNVLVPLELVLDYIGFPYYLHADKKSFDITTGSNVTNITIDRDTAVVDGVRIDLATAPRYVVDGENSYIGIALADIETLFPGWLTIYDDMGLILLYEDKTPDNAEDNTPIITRDTDLQMMIDMMKKFVFESVEADKADMTYIATGTKVYDDVKANTSDFSHPYIMANADTFAKLKAAFALTAGQEGYDERLNSYIQKVLDEAAGYYNANAQLSGAGAYEGIKADKRPVNPYLDGKNPANEADGITVADTSDGYDAETGKLVQIEEYAKILPVIAFAYQITGNADYAKFAYDWSVVLAEWSHWGPAYFDNCANATASIAISYDWLYNAYKTLGCDTDKIAAAIYTLGVHDGYISSSGSIGDHPVGEYNNSKSADNAVGSYGMITGALAILDYVDANDRMLAETVYLIGNNMKQLAANGLDIYAPDGSYSESAKQWELGTSSFFRMVMALVSASGSDYGFMSTWGMNKTCYFAIHIENSDGFAWNYNDASGDGVTSSNTLESLNTDMFNFVGSYYGDAALISVRQKQIAAGKSVSIFDLISYPVGKTIEDAEISLDYLMEGIDAYVSRSDWNSGAMYVGLMGGSNSGNMAQLDSGNFVYHNKGIVWFMDLGGEAPANTKYYDNSGNKYKYYRANAEGQNVLYIENKEDAPYGQDIEGYGDIVKTFANEHGSYAILDNTRAYPTGLVSMAHRGLLVTNDRKTVVIQDEIFFVVSEKVYWVAHTAHSIYIDPTTERTAYLTANAPGGGTITLRASIITPSTAPKFSVVSAKADDKILSGTTAYSDEYNRDALQRLVVTPGAVAETGVGSFTISVVLELVESKNDTTPVAYEWDDMYNWVPATYTVEDGDASDAVVNRGRAYEADIKNGTIEAAFLLKKNNAFSERLVDLYKHLTLVEYTLKKYPAENLAPEYASSYGDYLDCRDKYDAFFEYVNDSVEIVNKLSHKFTGIAEEEPEQETQE